MARGVQENHFATSIPSDARTQTHTHVDSLFFFFALIVCLHVFISRTLVSVSEHQAVAITVFIHYLEVKYPTCFCTLHHCRGNKVKSQKKRLVCSPRQHKRPNSLRV